VDSCDWFEGRRRVKVFLTRSPVLAWIIVADRSYGLL